MKFEEEKALKRSLDPDMEDQQGTTQVTAQSLGSPISGVTRSQVTGSSVIWAQSIGAFGIGIGSQVTPLGLLGLIGTSTGSRDKFSGCWYFFMEIGV